MSEDSLDNIGPIHMIASSLYHNRHPNGTGILCTFSDFGRIFRSGFLCGSANHRTQAAEVCPFVHVWVADIHGEFWNPHRANGSSQINVFRGPTFFHYYLLWKYVCNLVSNIFEGRNSGIRSCFVSIRNSSGGLDLVSHQLFARRCNGAQTRNQSDLHYAAANFQGVLPVADSVY